MEKPRASGNNKILAKDLRGANRDARAHVKEEENSRKIEKKKHAKKSQATSITKASYFLSSKENDYRVRTFDVLKRGASSTDESSQSFMRWD